MHAISARKDFGIWSREEVVRAARAMASVALISVVMHTRASVIASPVLVVRSVTHASKAFMDTRPMDADVSRKY